MSRATKPQLADPYLAANPAAQTLREIYYSQCLQIHLEQIEALLDEGLGIKVPMGTEFDLDDLLRMDGAALAEVVKTLREAGVMAPNEGRKKFGLKPMKGGDTPYLQQQNFSLAALAERDAGDPLAQEATPLALPAPDPEPNDAEAAKALLAMHKGLAHGIRR